MTYTQQLLVAGETGGQHREKINENMEYLFTPRYALFRNTANQSIPHATWTKLTMNTTEYNTTTSVALSSSTMVFQTGTNEDGDNVWHCLASVTWDNTLANLQMHQRKIRIKLILGGFPFPLATFDDLFDPAGGTSGLFATQEMQVSCHLNIKEAMDGAIVQAEVWHNAKVSTGSPTNVAINSMADGIQAPALHICRIGPIA